MANLKAKYYKLGAKASSFWDPSSKTKVLKGQVVKVEGIFAKSKRLSRAVANGHLVLTDEEEYNDYETSKSKGQENLEDSDSTQILTDSDENDSPDLKEFKELKLSEMKAKILEDYELDEDEKLEVEAFKKKEEAIQKFKELEDLE